MEPKIRWGYAHKCLSEARRLLMVPIDDEAQAIAGALAECSHAFDRLPEDLIDDHAHQDVETIRAALKTGPEHVDQVHGSFYRKARGMTLDEKIELSRAIDSLADWEPE